VVDQFIFPKWVVEKLMQKRPKTRQADVSLTTPAAFSIREKTLNQNPKFSINSVHPATSTQFKLKWSDFLGHLILNFENPALPSQFSWVYRRPLEGLGLLPTHEGVWDF
jgi:hypothetical protein